MSRTIAALTVAGLLASAPASAARHEVSYEFSNLTPVAGDYWEAFRSPHLPRFGVRLGYTPLENWRGLGVTVLAGYSFGVRGVLLSVDGDFDEDVSEAVTTDVLSSLALHTWGVGAKLDYDVQGFFFPYVWVDAEIVHGVDRLDDRRGDTTHPNQLRSKAVTGGGLFTLGFEFMLPDRRWGWPVTAGIYLEGGYEALAPARFADLGDLPVGGVAIRSGIGLRF